MTTKYPGTIDGYAEIRVARNRIDEIVAEDHNDLRSAILAIEQTLGINPQGPFGTVKARMDDAYQNIEAHVLGNPPRHQDTVIESPARSGVYHSLTQGTVGSQVVELLADINSLNFTSTSSYANGAPLVATKIRTAINRIVTDIGNNTSPDNTGGHKVGVLPFGLGSSGQYSTVETNVASQLRELGGFIDEAGRFRARAFDAFVTEGFEIAAFGSTTTVVIGNGYLAASGRLAKFNGAEVEVDTTPDKQNYIMAIMIEGSVQVHVVDAPVDALGTPEHPATVVAIIVGLGGSNWARQDTRRYGMHVNNKDGFTVGNPIAGRDGYAYDFNSIGAALTYMDLLESSGLRQVSRKLTIATNIIEEGGTIGIPSTLSGLEIDGGGHFVYLAFNAPLFDIEAQAVHIHDLKVLSNTPTVSDTAFAKVAVERSITGLIITNCVMSSSPTLGVPYPSYFLKVGEASGTYTLSASLISNNLARVREAAIHIEKPAGIPASIINNTEISNNVFTNMQTGGSVSSLPCIKASRNCMISNNVIDVNTILSPFEGAFSTGIEIEYGESSIIADNIINGGTSANGVPGSAMMETGILVRVSGGSNFARTTISGNIIKGVIAQGINCAGAGSVREILVCNNFITNRYDWTPTVATNFVGILGGNEPMYVVGNIIEDPGLAGIAHVPFVLNNIIYGNLTHAGLVAAIDLPSSGSGLVVDSNVIYECSGVGINCDGAQSSSISNNILYGIPTLSISGIVSMGYGCNVTNNLIRNYIGYGIGTTLTYNLLVNGNAITNNSGFGINLDGSESCIVVNNQVRGDNAEGAGIGGIGAYSLVSGNLITNYGAAGLYGIETVTGSGMMVTNNIIAELHLNTAGGILIASGGSGAVIAGNLISQCARVGIMLTGVDDTVCANNVLDGNDSISGPGIVGVGWQSVVIGNVIRDYCMSADDTAILCNEGADDVAIVDNIIHNCNGDGINMNGGFAGGVRLLIASNFMNGAESSRHGIIGINEYSLVANNSIINYGGLEESRGIRTDSSSGKTCIVGNIIWPRANMFVGIELLYDVYYLVANNIIGNEWSGMAQVGIDVNAGSRNFIIGNVVAGINSGGSGEDGIKDVGTRNIVANNFITTANDNGISIQGDFSLVSGNRIYNAFNDGISVQASADNNLIHGNFINWGVAGGRYAIGVDSALHTSVCGNYISKPTYVGIYIFNSATTLANSNYIFETGASGIGIYAEGSPNSNMVGNYIDAADLIGIIVISSNFSQINSNYIANSLHGIGVSAQDPNIIGNYIYNCAGMGIDYEGGFLGTIASNAIYTTGTYGVYVATTSNYSLIGNRVFGHTSTAYMLTGTDNFVAVGNSNFNPGTSSNVHGMDVTSTTDALIVGNRCMGGTGAGSVGFSGVTTNNTMSGNLAIDLSGSVTAIFAVGHAVPTTTNRRI